jgi:hypothetical protein
VKKKQRLPRIVAWTEDLRLVHVSKDDWKLEELSKDSLGAEKWMLISVYHKNDRLVRLCLGRCDARVQYLVGINNSPGRSSSLAAVAIFASLAAILMMASLLFS